MRILILHSRYLSWMASGENRVVDDETRLLRDAGHEVEVWDPPFSMSGPRLLRLGVDAVWSAEATSKVRRMIRDLRPQVVHCHNLFPTLSPAVLRAAADEDATVVMTLHNYRLMCLPGTFLRDGELCELCLGREPWPGVKYRCLRDSALGSGALAASIVLHRRLGSFAGISRFLAVSEFVRDKHVEAGFPSEKVAVKRNFAWPSPRRDGPGDYFVYIGRLSPEKGMATVIEAWGSIQARLVVIGDGSDATRLKGMAPPQVEFTGAVAPSEIPSLVAQARALLVPSRWYEPAPKAISEAYAAGVPVIASRIGGLPEMVEEDSSGFLVRPRDVDDWGRAVEKLLDDGTSLRLGDGAFALWRERFSPEIALRELERSYREAIAAAGP